jgi:hypothetical protein
MQVAILLWPVERDGGRDTEDVPLKRETAGWQRGRS